MRAIEGKVFHAIGKTRGGWGTKIHVVVDAIGLPIDLKITEGQVSDNLSAIELLDGKESENVIAGKAFDTDDIRRKLEKDKKRAVIPNQGRRCQKYDL